MTRAASRAPESSRIPPSTPGFTLQEGIWFGDFDDEEARRVAAASLTAMGGRIMGARPIPAAAQKLVQLTRDEDADIHKVVRVLEMDPGLSQKILRLVNSAGYGLRIRCTSLQHATALLGQVKLRQVATSAVLFDHFGKASPLTRKKQEHGALVASLCRYLAIHLGLPQDDLFTIGLLHDIGELMMLDDDLKGYAELLASTEGEFDVLHERERELFGFDHAALAAHVLASWSIPSPLPDVIALHHQPAVAHQHSLNVAAMVQTLRFADHMAHLLDQKNPRRSIAILAESEAASYLDFSEVQIAAMWRDLEKVQEVTKNRRLNIMDMAPRSVSVPDSLRPRGIPFSARAPEDRASRGPEAPVSRSLPEQIAVPSFRSPLALLRHIPEGTAVRAPDAEQDSGHPERNPTAQTAHYPKVAEESAEATEPPAPEHRGPVLSPLSTRRIEVPTFSVAPPTAPDHAPPPARLDPPAFDEEPRGARPVPSEESPRPLDRSPQPLIRPIFDGAHTDEVLLARLTGGAAEHEDSEEGEAEREPEPILAPPPHEAGPIERQEADSPWFEQAANDVSPEVFPCAFCYSPTFGASCSVCAAQTCPEHQLTSRQWCVACEDEFQSFLQSRGTSPMVSLSVGVTLAIAVIATWYFASLDGALGVLSIGIVLIFGLFVSHHVSLKRRFRIARKRALDELEDAAQLQAAPLRAAPDPQGTDDDPLSRTLEAIAEDEVTRSGEDFDPEGSPLSMPVPAPRAHGFVIAPICEPPRPSLMNFHRPAEHTPMFESMMAPGGEPEPSPVRIVGAPANPTLEAPRRGPLPNGGITPTWPAPSDEPGSPRPNDDGSTASSAAAGAPFPETPRSFEVSSAPMPKPEPEPEPEAQSSDAPERTRRGVAPPGDAADSRVEPLERALRSVVPEPEAEELSAIEYSSPLCSPGSPSAAIVVPELQSLQDYCFGAPQNTVSIDAARSA